MDTRTDATIAQHRRKSKADATGRRSAMHQSDAITGSIRTGKFMDRAMKQNRWASS
jgi:hypothetical protein